MVNFLLTDQLTNNITVLTSMIKNLNDPINTPYNFG